MAWSTRHWRSTSMQPATEIADAASTCDDLKRGFGDPRARPGPACHSDDARIRNRHESAAAVTASPPLRHIALRSTEALTREAERDGSTSHDAGDFAVRDAAGVAPRLASQGKPRGRDRQPGRRLDWCGTARLERCVASTTTRTTKTQRSHDAPEGPARSTTRAERQPMHEEVPGESVQPEPAKPPRSRLPSRKPKPTRKHEFDLNLLIVLRYRLHREAVRFGHGAWRVVDDPVDRALDRIVQAMREPRAEQPDAWVPYAVTIFRNLVRSGPGQASLRRGKTVSLTRVHESIPAPEPLDSEPPRRLSLGELLLDSLTPHETAAVAVVWKTRGFRAAARVLGWSVRDVRTRVRRAGEKLRREFG